MRTTLDIDDDVLQAAKELGRLEKRTAGRVLSDLARWGLTGGRGDKASGFGEPVMKDGWYTLPHREGVIVTKELVDRLIEEADWEDGEPASRG